jgi:hypothetical protein
MDKSPSRPEETTRSAQGVLGTALHDFSQDTETVWSTITRLGLAENIAELEVRGFTVLPPERVAPPEFIAALRDRILGVARRRTGQPLKLADGTTRRKGSGGENELYEIGGLTVPYLLLEDPLFQEAALNPACLAIIDYLIGKSATITASLAILKSRGEKDLPLHIDQVITPPPLAHVHQFCNVTWALTDYTRANGALCFVPGSHKYFRPPLPGEGVGQRVAVEAPAGSMILWPGSTWHGSFARTSPGLRVTLINQYTRPHLRPLEPYRENVPAELLERLPRRFATLMGKDLNHGWKEEGPQNEATAYNRGRHAYD